MRFHSSLTVDEVRSVELPPGVYWHHIREYGSRSRARGIEIVLEGTSCYGGQWGNRDYKAATWDEWGVVLGRLFALDPNARVAKVYEGREHYHWATGDRFHPDDLPERLCKRHKWQCLDYCVRTGEWVGECTKCEALRRQGRAPDPEPRDDSARTTERTDDGPRVWIGSSRDFLEGRTTPARRRDVAEVDTYGERYETYDGPYKGRDYAAEFDPADLLARIDELIKEG